MATYSYSGNEYTDKQNGVDRYLAEHVNDLQDEVEIVEGVLTGGTEGQVLTADATGKANWENASGGFGWAVPVNSDWSVADNIWTDIQAATGMEGRIISGGNYAIINITLWEGAADSDDYALVVIADNVAYLVCDFATAPASGTAYIIGIAYSIPEGLE